MTKVLKWLGGGVVAALLLGLAGGIAADTAHAQSPPTPPARFVGTVTIDGTPASAGTSIVAKVGDATCGTTSVFSEGGESRYALDVEAFQPGQAACGQDDSEVTFLVDGKAADQTGTWRNFDINILNLTVTTPEESPTPGPPPTGTGLVSDGQGGGFATPLVAILGVSTLVLGMGGLAVARRRQ